MPVTESTEREVYRLFHEPHCMSMGAIAKHLGLTKNQVAGIIHRGKKAGLVKLRRDGEAVVIRTSSGSVRTFTPREAGARKPRPNEIAKKAGVRPAPRPKNAAPAGPAKGGEPATPPGEHLGTRVEPARPAPILVEPPPPPPNIFKPRPAKQCCWPMWGVEKPTHVYCTAEVDPEDGQYRYCREHRLRAMDTKKMELIMERRRLRSRAA